MEFFGIPILTSMILVPLIGTVLTLLLGSKTKNAVWIALLSSATTVAIAFHIFYTVEPEHYVDLAENYAWIDAIGLKMSFALAFDGISALMVFLTSILVFVVVIFSAEENDRPRYFFSLLLAMEVGLMGVYLSADYFLFYIMWEVTLIPMFFMISWYGGPRRHYSAIKFFIYTHVASLVMLIGIFIMAFKVSTVTGVVDFSFNAVHDGLANTGSLFQTLVFGLLFFGFIVKMPIVPFHTWLPDAHVEAPTAGSVLLAGLMLKMGSYGIVRVCIWNFELGAEAWQWIMIPLGLISMIYGAYACIAQTDLKRMVAYSSISHMGMVLLGLGCLSEIGVQYAIFQMFAHGLITSVLFMVCGLAGHNIGTREIPLLGGLAGKLPMWSFFMMFGFMASLGLPGLVGFVAEFCILYGFWEVIVDTPYYWLILFGMLSMMLTAGYYIWAMQRTLFGDITNKINLSHVHDVSNVEFYALSIVVVLIAFFGMAPSYAAQCIDVSTVAGVF